MKKCIILIVMATLGLSMPMVAKAPITMYMVGDASMADYPSDSTLACGWGQSIAQYLAPHVKIINAAKPGMSARTFMEGEEIEKMKKLPARSIVFIQFGTNDLKEYDAEKYSSLEVLIRRLKEIITIAHQNRINVILCTPLAQPYYQDTVLIDRLGGYADAIRHISIAHHIALLDLEAVSRTWLANMTEQEAAAYYVTLDRSQLVNGEYQLNQAGAAEIAYLAKEAILQVNSKKLKQLLKK